MEPNPVDFQLLAAKVQALAPHLKGCDLEFERMIGITNQTYRVVVRAPANADTEKPENQPVLATYIYRQLGSEEGNPFLERSSEAEKYRLASQFGVGPRIFAESPTQRLEEFIVSRTMNIDQMLTSDIIWRVAFELNRFHKIPTARLPCQKPYFGKIFIENGPQLIQQLHKKLQSQGNKAPAELIEWASQSEIDFMKSLFEKNVPQDKLVFSHNDLLSNNILLRSNKRPVLIDYEYACLNFRGFDLANYINQSRFDYNVSKPPFFAFRERSETEEALKQLVRCYIIAENSKDYEAYLLRLAQPLGQSEQALSSQLLNECKYLRLLTNLVWGWWAILMARNTLIEFDYIEFSLVRLRQYRKDQQILKKK